MKEKTPDNSLGFGSLKDVKSLFKISQVMLNGLVEKGSISRFVVGNRFMYDLDEIKAYFISKKTNQKGTKPSWLK